MNCIKCGAVLPDVAVYCCLCGRKQIVQPRRKRVHANGQGSVFKLPNGKWRAEKTLGYRIEPPPEGSPPGTPGKKRRTTVSKSTFRTRSEALAALPFLTEKAKSNSKELGGSLTAQKGEQITLKELYDQWYPTHMKGKSTMNCYAAGFKLFAPLWDVPMADIDIDDLQDCLDDNNLGRRTRENAKTALGLVYKYGIPRNCVPKDRNLAPYLRINAMGSVSHRGLNPTELEAIRQLAISGSRDAQMVYCNCYLGFRPTGFIQLRIDDYNAVEQAFVGGIKTEAGIMRTVTVSPKIQRYVYAAIAGRTSGYVFCDDAGNKLSIRRYRSLFYGVLEDAGLDNPVDEQGRHRITPHSCRHTFATLMKHVVAPDKDKLELIGHTSTSQLRDYQDVSYEDLRRITDQI